MNTVAIAPEGECEANSRLIKSAPTMFGKLVDTVAWLDREIEDLLGCTPDYFRAAQIERLEELRDDLAETLRKITEGGPE